MNVAPSAWTVGFLVFGCASAGAGAARRPDALNLAGERTSQLPAEQDSVLQATAARTASETPPSAAPLLSVESTKEDDASEAELVESGQMTETQRLILRAVGRCLERHASGPGGSQAISVTVNGEGDVARVELGPGYSPSAGACVEARVKAVHFGKESGGGIRFYRYPINELRSEEPQ